MRPDPCQLTRGLFLELGNEVSLEPGISPEPQIMDAQRCQTAETAYCLRDVGLPPIQRWGLLTTSSVFIERGRVLDQLNVL